MSVGEQLLQNICEMFGRSVGLGFGSLNEKTNRNKFGIHFSRSMIELKENFKLVFVQTILKK